MKYFLLFLLVVGAFWLGIYAVEHSSDVTINYQWNKNPMSVSLTSTTLLIFSILGLIALYLGITILRFFFGLRKRLQLRKKNKLLTLANQELTKGLVHFTEGLWEQSEKTLLNNVAHSETPLLNYLAAARSAHMQEAYDRRDAYLKTASEQGSDAQIAVSVSQAEMQFSSNQLEQARATLIHLLEVAPKHPYAVKLLAKIYYQQEDWSNLFGLLSELDQLDLIKETDLKKYEATALKGIFHALALKKDVSGMQSLWKKLPSHLKENPKAILLYCEALSASGEETVSDKLLISELNKNWDEELVERYGLIEHQNLGNAIKQAEKWLIKHETSPKLLLALARLNRQYQLWGKSKSYYTSSLNFSPSADVYLELANLLEELGETENAQICYKLGLNYSIHRKGVILKLQTVTAKPMTSLRVVPEKEDQYT